jgi:putative tricarboxylic transport membrane protein
MLEAIVSAASRLLDIDVILILCLGVVVGMVFGALPGLSGMTALAVALPLTFGWEPITAIYFFIAIVGSCTFAGSIPAILLNTPGTAPNAVTCLDGYPMARKGQAGRALGISATASGLGALFGVVVLVALMPAVRTVVLAFGSPEFFWLVVLGLVSVSFATKGNMMKVLVAGGLGILLSLIGFSPVLGTIRFSGDSMYLWDGVSLVPFVIGLFAVSELINYTVRGGTIAEDRVTGRLSGVLEGIKEVFKYKLTFFRSSVIGTSVGIVPVIGGPVAAFFAYLTTMQSSKHPETFGTGDPEGVIAPEAANDADGGALLPTIAFGIPGSPIMALLLAGFVLHGIVPGPLLLRDHLDLVWVLIFGLVVSNVLTSTIGLLIAPYLAKITSINVSSIAPVVLLLCVAGAFIIRGNIWDVPLMLAAGLFGYGMIRAGFPIITLVIGFLLGRIAEKAFHQALMSAYGSYAVFFTRPIALVLFILVVIVLLLPLFSMLMTRKGSKSR